MMSSGKCSSNSNEECQMQSKSLLPGKLHNNEFCLLSEAYKKLYPRYAELCTMYEADSKKSKHSKHTSQNAI